MSMWCCQDKSMYARLAEDKSMYARLAEAFAAILGDGSVVTWGNARYGGGNDAVQEQQKNVQQIQATKPAFAAILGDGWVVTWGLENGGGDSSAVQDQLKNVLQIQAAAHGAFAAILGDGSVVTWGASWTGGDSSSVQEQLRNVQQIQATASAFSAICGDGSIVAWGGAGVVTLVQRRAGVPEGGDKEGSGAGEEGVRAGFVSPALAWPLTRASASASGSEPLAAEPEAAGVVQVKTPLQNFVSGFSWAAGFLLSLVAMQTGALSFVQKSSEQEEAVWLVAALPIALTLAATLRLMQLLAKKQLAHAFLDSGNPNPSKDRGVVPTDLPHTGSFLDGCLVLAVLAYLLLVVFLVSIDVATLLVALTALGGSAWMLLKAVSTAREMEQSLKLGR
eukprot:s2453_g8.t1